MAEYRPLSNRARILVTGGVRSGKSRHAEDLLADFERVHYIASGPSPDTDTEWADRVAAHQERRPEHWRTHETTDLAAVLNAAAGPVLIDCLGTWLTARIDAVDGWNHEPAELHSRLFRELGDVLDAMRDHQWPVIAVTNEVGWGIVPEHRSGRLFRDLLGSVNQRWAAASDQVHLVVAGRVLVL